MFREETRMGITIYSDVAQRSSAVVLHVRIRRVEQTDKDRNSTGVDELLPVLVCEWSVNSRRGYHQECMQRTRVRHVEQSTGCIALNTHVLRACKAGKGNKSTRLRNLRLVVV